MNNLSETILNYAKEVNLHGNNLIYYRYRNKNPGQYEGTAIYFQSLMVTCITLYINMVACLLSIALMNQRKK